MREIGQALSSTALDGYSRLSAGAVWLIIHVYVRVHIFILRTTRKRHAYDSLSHLITKHQDGNAGELFNVGIAPLNPLRKTCTQWMPKKAFWHRASTPVLQNAPGNHCNIVDTCLVL
jgi:hypothetical protein